MSVASFAKDSKRDHSKKAFAKQREFKPSTVVENLFD